MQFILLPDKSAASHIMAERLQKELTAHKQVLWLISGGSNIAIEAATLRALSPALLANLTVMPCDERYGPYGHNDSNLQQLHDAGFPEAAVKVIPVLVPESLPLEATSAHFTDNVQAAFAAADSIIAQLGMGSDGHIAGILPNSAAVDATGLVTHYESDPFERITMTFNALQQATAVYVFAFGPDKLDQLERLRDDELPVSEQPAQFLKRISDTYVYNDQIATTSEGGNT
jgi:6-phosphogluconolactonase/glucosamine-6-phosphate isomerase/deaminase